MASPEFHALQEKMASAPPPPPPASIQELRDRIDANLGQLPLAEGTTATEVDANGVHSILCARDGSDDAALIVYFHGGGFRIASALSYRAFGTHLAKAAKARVLVVDYRLAPENPFPAAVEDTVSAYQWVLDQGTPASKVVIAGDSAGGGLTASLLLAARDRGMPLPAGAACLSPWVDLTNSAFTYESRSGADKLFSKTSADEARSLYLGDHDPKDPLASPIFGAWSDMPPLLILVGDAEVLLDDAAQLASVAAAAGVDVEHHVYPEMPHVWPISYPAYPEAVDAVMQVAEFTQRVTAS
jgi:monoterpene epsilon-lactone hydrolase